jgi:hypothetical protein
MSNVFSLASSEPFSHKIATTLRNGVTYLGNFFSKMTNLSKLSNIASKIIKFVQIIFGEDQYPLLEVIKQPIKAFKNVTSTAKLIVKTKDLFELNKQTPVLRIIHKIVSFVTSILKTIKFFVLLGLINLAKIAEAIGKIPVLGAVSQVPLGTVINIFQFGVSVLGSIEDAVEFFSIGKNMTSQNQKLEKWQTRSQDVEAILTYLNEEARLRELRSQARQKATPVKPDETPNPFDTSSYIGVSNFSPDYIPTPKVIEQKIPQPKEQQLQNVGSALQEMNPNVNPNPNIFDKWQNESLKGTSLGFEKTPSGNQIFDNDPKPSINQIPTKLTEVVKEIPGKSILSSKKSDPNLSSSAATKPMFDEVSDPLLQVEDAEEIKALQEKVNNLKTKCDSQRAKLKDYYTKKTEDAKSKMQELSQDEKSVNKGQLSLLYAKVIKWSKVIDCITGNDPLAVEKLLEKSDNKAIQKSENIEQLKQTRIQRIFSFIYRLAKVVLAAASVILFFTGIATPFVVVGFIALNVLTYSFGIFKFFWQEAHPRKQ